MKRLLLVTVTLVMISCTSYKATNTAFESIVISGTGKPFVIKKAEMLKYKKGTNYKTLEFKSSDFEIVQSKINKETYLTPMFDNEGAVTSDIKLIVNDSVEFKISDIVTVRDTMVRTFTLSKRYYISNIIKSFKLNSEHVDNDDYRINIKYK